MNKVKLGQIGVCHEHAGAKMKTFRAMPDVFEFVGVVDDRDTGAARFTGDDLGPYEGLRWLSEDELFAIPDLQAVAVETPNMDLIPTALRCMKRGLHMHVDKPAGNDLGHFKALLAGCQQRKLAVQLGYMLRNNPAVKLCHKAVRQGWLGEVFQIDAGMNHDYGGKAYQRYLANFKGGIMFNLGCHLIDVVISILGRPDNVSAFPNATCGVDPRVNNNGLAVLSYPHATATIRSCDQEVDGIRHRRLTVCGTKGTIEQQPLECNDGTPLTTRLTLRESNDQYSAGTHHIEHEPMTDRYQAQLLELARVINGEIENPYTYEHECLVQEVLLAAAGYTDWQTPNI